MSLNHYMFSGFLVKPPVTLEDEATGKPYLRFRLEGRKNVRTKAPYNFVDFVARGKVAEFCYNYLIVGQYITVEGEISSRPFSANGHAIALPELIALRIWNDRSRDVPIDTTKAEKIGNSSGTSTTDLTQTERTKKCGIRTKTRLRK